MKLKEFSGEDLTQYKLSTGKDLFVEFGNIVTEFNRLTTEVVNIPNHRTMVVKYKNDISDCIDDIIKMHNYCLNSEDDADTSRVANSLKGMFEKLNSLSDSL